MKDLEGSYEDRCPWSWRVEYIRRCRNQWRNSGCWRRGSRLSTTDSPRKRGGGKKERKKGECVRRSMRPYLLILYNEYSLRYPPTVQTLPGAQKQAPDAWKSTTEGTPPTLTSAERGTSVQGQTTCIRRCGGLLAICVCQKDLNMCSSCSSCSCSSSSCCGSCCGDDVTLETVPGLRSRNNLNGAIAGRGGEGAQEAAAPPTAEKEPECATAGDLEVGRRALLRECGRIGVGSALSRDGVCCYMSVKFATV